MFDKFIGPATLVYLVGATAAGIWWASDLSARVAVAENQVQQAAAAGERIARVETVLLSLDKQLDRIDSKLDRQNNR